MDDTDYYILLRELPKDLKLNNGNCGSFAIALKEIFGKGELVGISNGLDGFVHIFLRIGNGFYDGNGIWREFQIRDNWLEYIEIIEPISCDDAIEGTMYYLTFNEMKDIILGIAQKQNIELL